MQWNIKQQKEWNPAICSNIDGPRGYCAKWNKSDKDKWHMDSLIGRILKNQKKQNKTDSQEQRTNWL